MINHTEKAGTLLRRCRIPVAAVFVFIALITVLSPAEDTPGSDGDKWRDSMIVAGVRSLARKDIAAARRHFTAAYKYGMSKDSMHYFAAEIFLRSGAPDTALTFNWALEKGGHFDRVVYLEQRARIYRSVGWHHAADSVEALYRKRTLHDIILSVSEARNCMALEQLTILPQQLLLEPPDDIDDAGNGGIRYRWSYYTSGRLKKTFLELDVNTQIPVPSSYSFDDANDTLMRSISVSLGAGELPNTPEFVSSYRARIHDDGKIDHYLKGTLTLIAGKRGLLSAEHQLKLIRNEGVDDARTGLSLTSIPKGRKIKGSFGLAVEHHFAKLDIYQNQVDVWGKHNSIPIGFVDSLNYGGHSDFYLDQKCTVPFSSRWRFDEYWKGQPGLQLHDMPEHDLNAALKSFLQFSMPLRINVNVFSVIQTVWYPESILFFTFDDPIIISDVNSYEEYNEKLYKNYALIFNTDDGKYYLTNTRQSWNIDALSLEEVHFRLHKKRRIDCYLSFGMMVERRFKTIGKIYVAATYLKCFSTMNENDPVAILDYMWMVRTGWKMEFSFGRK